MRTNQRSIDLTIRAKATAAEPWTSLTTQPEDSNTTERSYQLSLPLGLQGHDETGCSLSFDHAKVLVLLRFSKDTRSSRML
jgi:hypothetical protein